MATEDTGDDAVFDDDESAVEEETEKDAKGRKKGRKDKSGRSRTTPALFVRQVVSELRKVIWPTRNELLTYTAVSLIFVLILVGIVSVVDWGLQRGVFALFT